MVFHFVPFIQINYLSINQTDGNPLVLVFLSAYFFGILYIVSWYVSPHTTTTQNCTTLQPSISTHTQKYTQTHTFTQNTHTRTKNNAPCITLPAGSHNSAIRELLFPILIFSCVYRILLYVYVYIYVYMYIYCCFRYLNGVCPIRDDHCGHPNTNTMRNIVQACDDRYVFFILCP